MAHDPQVLAAIELNEWDNLRALSIAGNPLNENGESYFDVAASKILKEKGPNSLKVLEELLSKGVVPTGRVQFNLRCIDNVTSYPPLIRAIGQNLPLVFDFLLRNSADLNQATTNGLTPLCEASYYARPEMLQKLIDSGVNVFVGYDRYNPLGFAFATRKDDEKFRNKEYMENSAQCIHILLDNYAGIGHAFNFLNDKNAISGLNFRRKMCLGATINAEQKKSLGNPIVTIEDYAKTLPDDKNLAIKEVSKMIEICTKIAKACRQSDANMYDRVSDVIDAFHKKYPEAKALIESTKKPDSKGPLARLLGIFRRTTPVNTTPASSEVQSSTVMPSSPPDHALDTPASSTQAELRPPPIVPSPPPEQTFNNPVSADLPSPTVQQKR